VETAIDVSEESLATIKGIGPVLRRALMDWRESVERSFSFDTKKAIPQHELRSLHMHFDTRRKAVKRELNSGVETLSRIAMGTRRKCEELATSAARLMPTLAQARPDVAIRFVG